MKKFFRILLITLGVILALLILIPTIFKSRIEETVKQKVNENVHATVDWHRFGLSWFRSFPYLSIDLHGLSVVGMEEFGGDTLVSLERFHLAANPFSAFKKDIKVKSILLDKPLINGIVLEDGKANWDIAVPAEPVGEVAPVSGEPEESSEEESVSEAGKVEEGGVSAFGVSLKSFTIRDGKVSYDDAAMGLKAVMGDLDMEVSGDLSMAETEILLDLDVAGIDASMGGIRYMHEGNLGVHILAAANLVDNTYSMLDNEIRINGLILGIEGNVQLHDDGGIETALDFFSKETTFQTLLSLVPAVYLHDFESLKTSGSLVLNGRIEGMMKDSLLPDARLVLEVKDGYFAYPDLPKDVSDVQIKLVAEYDGADMDRSTVELERFTLSLGGNPFSVALKVDHPISDMHVAGAVKGSIDFATLKDVVPLEDMQLGGRLTADLDLDTRMSYIEQERYEEVDLDGLLRIEGMEVESESLPVPVILSLMELNFNPRFVELAALDLELGNSDLHVNGQLTNFIPYVFEDATVSGALNVSSQLLDANEFLPEEGEEGADEAESEVVQEDQAEPAEETEPLDSSVIESPVKIPVDISFNLDLNLARVIYDSIEVENIQGTLRLEQGVAYLDGLSLDVIDGSITATGKVDTRDDLAAANLNLDMLNVDIPLAYSSFVSVEKLAPMAKYCVGKANIKLDMNTLLDRDFAPVYENLDVKGQVFTRNVRIYNMKSFVRLSELLKNEKFRDMMPNDMNIKFKVAEGRVMVDPFDMDFEDSKINVSGSHGIDLSMDYLLKMDIAKNDLGSGANAMMNSVTSFAAGAGLAIPQSDYVKVDAGITGQFSDPKVKVDFSRNLGEGKASVKEVAEEKIMEVVEEKEEEIREEASEKADEILRQAQEKADRILAEAEKTGDLLVKEAEKQGEKLVEEAGSNPLKKIAAQEGAKALVREAQKKKEQLMNEARSQSDAILSAAGEEADKIK